MSELKLAASNIGWTEADDVQVFNRMAELGLSGLEVAPTRLFQENPYMHIDDFAEWTAGIRSSYGLSVCSLQSIWRGRPENLFDDAGATILLDYTASACEFAKAGDVGNLVFGCPTNRNVPEGHDRSQAIPFIVACGNLAANVGAVFALEANPPIYQTNFLNTTQEAITYLEALKEKRGLGLNLDIGAMICADEGIEIVEQALPYISHVHISEPKLAPIEPRELHRQLRSILEDVEYSGYVSLEMSCSEYNVVCRSLEYLASTFLG